MKNYFAAALFMAASIAAAPAVPVYIAGREQPAAAVSEESGEAAVKPSAPEAPTENVTETASAAAEFTDESYKVLDAATGEVMEVAVRDYVIGAVCAEMPAAFPEETFTEFVERCIVLPGKMVTFEFRCGLKLTESLYQSILEDGR